MYSPKLLLLLLLVAYHLTVADAELLPFMDEDWSTPMDGQRSFYEVDKRWRAPRLSRGFLKYMARGQI